MHHEFVIFLRHSVLLFNLSNSFTRKKKLEAKVKKLEGELHHCHRARGSHWPLCESPGSV